MPRTRGKIELSLFPFLNILFSLIGVLILYIFVVLVMGRGNGRASVQAGLHDAGLGPGVGGGKARGKGDAGRLLKDMQEKKAGLQEQLDQKTRELQQLHREEEQLAELLDLRKRQGTMPAAGTSTVGVP